MTRLTRAAIVVGALLLLPGTALAAEDSVAALRADLDLLWVLIAAGLVFFMQAGFLALEVGAVRSKNTATTALKNVGDWVIVSITFFLVGYGLMFGKSDGYVGMTRFAGDGLISHADWVNFLFQLAFAGTAATIVSGAIAERTTFKAYLVYAVVIGSVTYPVFGHWAWNPDGWLRQMGYHDFAGSSVVHMVGGFTALIGCLVVGPRLGRFARDGRVLDMPASSSAWMALGTCILWLSWWGFNGGSTLAFTANVAPIIVKTNIAGAAAAITAVLHSLVFQRGDAVVAKFLGGALGGLVAITAGCDVVSVRGAFAIGAGAGLLHNLSYDLVLKVWRVDDVVGAVPVHGFCGAFGVLMVPFFSPVGELGLARYLAVQGLGVATCIVWTTAMALLTFYGVRAVMGLRVAPIDEIEGLNLEHEAQDRGTREGASGA